MTCNLIRNCSTAPELFNLSRLFSMWALITLCSVVSCLGQNNSVDKELILTQKEKDAFDVFKSAVYKNLTFEFMKQDLFLLRWVRAKNLDTDKAKQDMLNFLNFIRENKIEQAFEEDWSDLSEDYPYTISFSDRKGRPVTYLSLGSNWKMRTAIVQGRRQRLRRYVYKVVFEGIIKLLEISRKQPNVTQFVVLGNLNGFNTIQHACPLCVSEYLNLLDNYERFFPGFVNEIIVVNAPRAYLILLQTLRPALSKNTRNALHVFGPNKRNWKPYLDARIDPDNLNDID